MAIENATNLAITLMQPVLEGRQAAVEVVAEAEAQYVASIQKALRGMVWNLCHSWYKSDEDGWNPTMYPWSQLVFWWRCKFPTWPDWTYSRSRAA